MSDRSDAQAADVKRGKCAARRNCKEWPRGQWERAGGVRAVGARSWQSVMAHRADGSTETGPAGRRGRRPCAPRRAVSPRLGPPWTHRGMRWLRHRIAIMMGRSGARGGGRAKAGRAGHGQRDGVSREVRDAPWSRRGGCARRLPADNAQQCVRGAPRPRAQELRGLLRTAGGRRWGLLPCAASWRPHGSQSGRPPPPWPTAFYSMVPKQQRASGLRPQAGGCSCLWFIAVILFGLRADWSADRSAAC